MNIAFPSCPPLEGVRGRIRIARGAIPTTTSTSGGGQGHFDELSDL